MMHLLPGLALVRSPAAVRNGLVIGTDRKWQSAGQTVPIDPYRKWRADDLLNKLLPRPVQMTGLQTSPPNQSFVGRVYALASIDARPPAINALWSKGRAFAHKVRCYVSARAF